MGRGVVGVVGFGRGGVCGVCGVCEGEVNGRGKGGDRRGRGDG